jgi:hypothetical protein
MKSKILLLMFLLIISKNQSFGQSNESSNYFQIGGYADLNSEIIYLHYMRVGIQHYFNNRLSIQGSLKFGTRSRIRWRIPRDGVPINWINWHEDNPNGNPFIFLDDENQPTKFGISSYPINDESLFYSNVVFSGGWRTPIFFKGNLEFLAGLGLRYTDLYDIGESGDAIFEYEGTEYQIYYLVPIYQRGLDAHFNFESNITFPVSEKLFIRGNLLVDFTFGSMDIGIGNYISTGLSLLVKI